VHPDAQSLSERSVAANYAF